MTLKREVCEGSQAGAGGAGLAGGNVNMCVYSFSLFFCLQFCLTASLRRPGKPEFTTSFRVSVYGFSDAPTAYVQLSKVVFMISGFGHLSHT